MKTVAVASIAFLASVSCAGAEQLPPNTISCEGWQKLPNGDWHGKSNNPPFRVAGSKEMAVMNANVRPHEHNLGGYDLYALLEMKCGGTAAGTPRT